jgi:hypothetical protein
MSSVNFAVDTSALNGTMNFQQTIDGMSSALQQADSSLKDATNKMTAGDPTSVMKTQIAMASFTQVLTSMTQVMKALQDATSAINRNISS